MITDSNNGTNNEDNTYTNASLIEHLAEVLYDSVECCLDKPKMGDIFYTAAKAEGICNGLYAFMDAYPYPDSVASFDNGEFIFTLGELKDAILSEPYFITTEEKESPLTVEIMRNLVERAFTRFMEDKKSNLVEVKVDNAKAMPISEFLVEYTYIISDNFTQIDNYNTCLIDYSKFSTTFTNANGYSITMGEIMERIFSELKSTSNFRYQNRGGKLDKEVIGEITYRNLTFYLTKNESN